MAVTQNLARLSDAMISECTTSTATLNDVCSFRGLKSSEYLDLDWAPSLLKQAAAAADVDAELLGALDRATSGEGEVNPTYREMPDSIWEHPASFLRSTQVAAVDKLLQTLARLDFFQPRTSSPRSIDSRNSSARIGQPNTFGGTSVRCATSTVAPRREDSAPSCGGTESSASAAVGA